MKKIALLVLAVMLISATAAWAQEGTAPEPALDTGATVVPSPGDTLMPATGETVAPSPGDTVTPAPGATAAPAAKEKKKAPAKEKEKPAAPKINDRVVIKVNYWTTNYTGDIKIPDISAGDSVSIGGQKLDLNRALGLESRQSIPELEMQFKMGKTGRFTFSYYTVDYGGDKRLNGDVDFAGYTFTADTRLRTTFVIDRYSLMSEYLPLDNDRGRIGLKWGVEIYWWKVGFEGKAEIPTLIPTTPPPTKTIKSKFSQPIPIPQMGISGALNIAYGFGIYGSFTGLGASYPDPKISASYTNLDLGCSFRYKLLYSGIGYRATTSNLEAEMEKNKELAMHLSNVGWYWSLGINF